jgi:hypothetical protein
LRRTLLFLVLIALAFAALDAPAAPRQKNTASTMDLRSHPYGGKQPVEVALGLYITNLAFVEETREQFQVEGYLTMQWHDPRLALTASQANGAPRTLNAEETWTPPIEAANLISHRRGLFVLQANDNGDVKYVERADVTLSTSYSLRDFPFDTQLLDIRIEPFLPSVSEIRFASEPLSWTGNDAKGEAELAAWDIRGLRYSIVDIQPKGAMPSRPQALFQVEVKRRTGFYLFKIILPMLLLAAIPWTVFWFDVKDFAGEMGVPLSIVLSMVAFQLAMSRDLPRVAYVTFLDALFFTSFVFAFLCIAEVAIAYILQSHNHLPQAVKLHRIARWAFPLTYFSVLGLLVVIY